MRITVPICFWVVVYLHVTACYSTGSAQTITGRIVDKQLNPVANATVSLAVKKNSVTSDAAGIFTINATAIHQPILTGASGMPLLRIAGMNLIITNELPTVLSVELFDLRGKRHGAVYHQQFGAGSFVLPLSPLIVSRTADGLYLVRITNGDKTLIHMISPLGISTGHTSAAIASPATVAKKFVTADTLHVTKEAYKPIALAFDSDIPKDFGDILLEQINGSDSEIEKKVDSLLALMDDVEKIAQTAEVLVDIISPDDLKNKMYGSVFNGGGCPFGPGNNTKEKWASNLDAMHTAAQQSKLGIPILYGIDAVHGNATIAGATVFPHNIGMGCTGDTALVAKMANITAKECRAVGINLNFGPAISVVRNERWGRSYEGYGETPEINALMAGAYVRGLQGYGDLSRPDAVAACAKHFIGDGGTTDGTNGGVTNLTEATIRAVHLPPYQAAIREGVASIMPSYNAWMRDGQEYRCTNDKFVLTDLLKTELGWNGFCLSDWDAIFRATSETEYNNINVSAAINAGIDMAMISKDYMATDNTGKQQYVSDYLTAFTSTLGSSTIQNTRLDDAVRRILRVKFRLRLFGNAQSNASLLAEFGSAAHRAVARECVQKSLVLLKNDKSALPLKKTEKVVVVGPWADKLGPQCGGWTIEWQGLVESPTIVGTTILKGLQEVGGVANVTYSENGENLSAADKIVLVVGEGPYAETEGDHGFKNASWPSCVSCDLYKNQEMSINLGECPHASLIDKCAQAGKPVVLVLISGRPLIITPQLEKCDAFVAAWLPGSEGGGVADVLYGDKKFTGKLTHTWPQSFEQIPINTGTLYTEEQKGTGGTPLFEYGFGLTTE